MVRQRQPFAFDVKHLDRAPTARKFEGGSPPIPNIYAAKRSLALIEDVGRNAIAPHVASLTQYLLQGLASLGLSLKTPPTTVGPLVVIRCTAAAEMCELLAKQGIVVSSRHDGLRVSLHLYNTWKTSTLYYTKLYYTKSAATAHFSMCGHKLLNLTS